MGVPTRFIERATSSDGTRRCECVGCSNRFTPSKYHPLGWQRYCSRNCKQRQWKRDRYGHRPSVVIQMECPHGHEHSPENTYVDKDGRRHCRKCRMVNQQRWRDKNRERVRELNRLYHYRHREARNLDRKIRKALGDGNKETARMAA